jgi:hypothetical protein
MCKGICCWQPCFSFEDRVKNTSPDPRALSFAKSKPKANSEEKVSVLIFALRQNSHARKEKNLVIDRV